MVLEWPGYEVGQPRLPGAGPGAQTIPLGLASIPMQGTEAGRLFPPSRLLIGRAAVAGLAAERGRPVQALPPLLAEYADLALLVRGRTELGGSWTRFEPCNTGIDFTCEPNIFPRLDPEVLLSVRAEGTVLDRIAVDIDYDQAREFGPANRINLLYRGRNDELVQRLELGDVRFDLPDSRFLTRGVPSGNFGFLAGARLGAVDVDAVWAQQSGDLNSREFRLTGAGDRQGFVQEDTLVVDDADYASGQFFFLFDPARLADYPHIDVLDLDPSSAPDDLLPGPEPIQLYRYESEPFAREQVQGYIQADAVAGAGGQQVVESGWFQYLQPGVDYTVHPSGAWVALRTPLSRDEMLAVTYIAASGDTIGDYNPERIYTEGGRPQLRLLKASSARHRPGLPTWELEMHQIYRISAASDVEPGSIELSISLGEPSAGRTFTRGPGGEDITYLGLFGLDEDAPVDALDRAAIYQPARESFELQPPVQGTFLVFPTLTPFARPPPLRSLGLTAEETSTLLGPDANRRIYEAEDPFERTNGGLFRLSIPFRIRSEDVISNVSLGAFGIRPGSERITLGERRLQPGIDYEIDYDIGQVRLLEPDRLFASAEEPVLRAVWEQQSFFQIAPTSVLGLNATYEVGEIGQLSLLGLYQREQTLIRRPQLGVEPSALLLGGVNGSVGFDAGWLDGLLRHVPGLRVGEGGARLTLSGELAAASPEPNLRGAAYIDDFDATDNRPLSLLSSAWVRGSAIGPRDGAEAVLPQTLDRDSYAPLSWQHNYIVQSPAGDSLGIFEGLIPRQDIDQAISAAGAENREPVLRLTFGPPGAPPSPVRRWSSITTNLSTTGTDLTKAQYLEFYARRGSNLRLVIDLGEVGEDAFFVDDEGEVTGTQDGTGEPWGLGRLDLEADPRLGQIWGADEDSRGVWGERCLARRGAIYPLGDPDANCTRGNGVPDSEDLDEDGILDEVERYFRYVVELGSGSPYVERSLEETGTAFRLYRIPLEGPLSINVNGVTESDWRAVKHLRLTVVGEGADSLVLARMRIVGSRWVPRGEEGVVIGIDGDEPADGRLDVGPVSVLTEGTAYSSPPGVLEELDDPQSAFGGVGVEFNEKSIGLVYDGVGPDSRAEVWQRFPQRPRSFLDYRSARIWIVAREGEWGDDRDVFAYLKVGEDRDNFYLWRTRLRAPPPSGRIVPTDWLPEGVIDFDVWLELRAEAERRIVVNPPAPGGPPITVWSADSTYAVVLRDRARAPNLAQVRELALGVWNRSGAPIAGELWFDELRLGDPVRNPGVATRFEVAVGAPGVLDARFAFSERGARYRQVGETPTYEDDRNISASATVFLDRLLPESWRLQMPLTLSHRRFDSDPVFLFQSDVRAEGLPDLRQRESAHTRVGLTVRRADDPAGGTASVLLSGLEARVGWSASSASALTVADEVEGVDFGLSWTRSPAARELPLVPAPLAPVISAILPSFLEERVIGARLRWTPERVRAGSSYLRRDGTATRFDQILELPADRDLDASRSLREDAESSFDLALRPFQSLTAGIGFRASRDLTPASLATRDSLLIPALERERRSFGGIDLGWETLRDVDTRLRYAPDLAEWIEGSLTWEARYRSDRDPSFGAVRSTGPDTLRLIERNARGGRDLSARVSLDPGRLIQAGGAGAAAGGLAGLLRPVVFDWTSGLTARFDRDPITPGAGFQLGIGGADDFRFVGADTAATFGDRESWAISGGMVLPSQLILSTRYGEGEFITRDSRSGRRTSERSWPDVNVRWDALPVPTAWSAVLLGGGIEVGFTRFVRELTFGDVAAQRRFDESERVPVTVDLRWGAGIRTSWQMRALRETGGDPTGRTRREELTHTFQASSTLSPVSAFGSAFDTPVELSIRYVYDADRYCRAPSGGDRCVAFLDRLDRSADLTLSTVLSDFELGVTASFQDGQSFVGRFPGTTRFQLGLWGEFLIQAGNLR